MSDYIPKVMVDIGLQDGCQQCGNMEFSTIVPYYSGEDREVFGALCEKCQVEYLRHEFVIGEEEHGESSVTLIPRRGALETDDPVHQVKGHREQIHNKEYVEDMLKPGDHISWHRPWLIWHHAIVVEVKDTNLTIIHWSKNTSSGVAEIIKEKVCAKEQLGEMYLMKYSEEERKWNPAELVLARAHAKIGRGKYKLLNNNCEGFATFCKTGVNRSQQRYWLMGKIGGLLEKLQHLVIQKGVSTSLRVSLTEALEVSSKSVLKLGSAEAVETLMKGSNVVGAGIVFAIEGVRCTIDISKLYEKRKNANLTRNEFVKSAFQRIVEGLTTAGCMIGGSILGEMVAVGIGAAVGTVAGPLGIFIGAVVGGVVGGMVGAALGPCLAPHIARGLAAVFLKTDDIAVKDLKELSPGDQVVLTKTTFHPRCHGILTEVNVEKAKIKVIRNKFKIGVVEEWVGTDKPIYKIRYPIGKCHPPEKVIERARENLGPHRYNLLTYNCKDFAYWCKTIQSAS